MAGCYHDTQDFKSDLNIEVAREGDILKEGQELKDRKCDKNPGHRGFIPFKDLTLEHLPIEDRNREMLDDIKKMGRNVVRLVVDKIVNGKQKKTTGSGCVYMCKDKYFIVTNNHVVKTDDDVKHCTVEFHYDDDSRSSVVISRGVELIYTCHYRDITLFTFHPVPDFKHQLNSVYDKLPDMIIMLTNNQIKTEIPYPYKNNTQYVIPLNLNTPFIDLMFVTWPDSSICYIKSSYFKFQPIPSNIQQLTSLDIHIDEDDGNSRVIPGDVVKIGDEFVVAISESIFQDEVKKCRLVWNGDVIGRGTRLYFQQVKSSDMYSGIDLELEIEQGREYWWVFEFHPMTKYAEALRNPKPSNYCYCIGHPHGAIKMVTFGRIFDVSPERFDNQYRHITAPGKNCKCMEVRCIKYSCKTCPGSSGSSVFGLSERTDMGHGFNHFMGKKVEMVLSNGELIENINFAWAQLLFKTEPQGKYKI